MAVYTLFSGNAHGLGNGGSTNGYSLGVQFSVSQNMSLTGIWWYSGASAAVLPTACAIYNANTGAQVAGTLNSSPSWSGAAGSGFVKCAYSGSVTLASGTNYVAVIFYNGGSLNWYYDVANYWTSGGGGSGITNGPLSAPNSAGAVNGQAVYLASAGSIAFPNTTVSGYDFGVDVEVTTPAATAAPDVPQVQPGPFWTRLFKPWIPRPVPPPPALQAVGATGSLSLAPVTLSGHGAQSSPDIPQVQPGPAWFRWFKPQWPRPVPPVAAVQAVSATGSLTLAPLALSGQAAQSSPDVPQADPGPVWQRLFRPWLARPVPPVPATPAVSATGSLALAPLSLSGTAGQTSPDQPQADPGPLWLRLFRPWAARPLPPVPATPAVSATGSLALAPLTLSGSGGQSSPDVPQASPGPFWLRIFKPGLYRPVPPPPAVQGINATGSLALAPLALSGTGAQTSPDQPQIAPGSSWLRWFKPGLARPAPVPPSSSGVIASGGITLAPLALSGQGAQTSPDVPAITPGPVWLRLFRPWQPRQVPPLPGPNPPGAATCTGSLSLAPLSLSGTGAQSSPDVRRSSPAPYGPGYSGRSPPGPCRRSRRCRPSMPPARCRLPRSR